MTLEDSSESESAEQVGIDHCVTFLPIKDSHDSEGDVTANTCLSFQCSGTDVRRSMKVRMLKKWGVGWDGLDFEHVKSSGRKNTAL
jgi:hypothetical protein